MRQKRWDLQLDNKLHIIEFEHGRLIKKHRRLLVDGEPAEPENWRVYSGKSIVTEYLFRWKDHLLTVVIRQQKRRKTFDLLLDGVSIESGRTLDLLSLSEPKSKKDKIKEALFWITLFIVWRIVVGLFPALF